MNRLMNRKSLLLSILLGAVTWTGAASAQDVPPPPPPPTYPPPAQPQPPVYVPPPPAYPPQPGYPQPGYGQPVYPPPPGYQQPMYQPIVMQPEVDHGRFRFGIDLTPGTGYFGVSGSPGAAGGYSMGLGLRLGWQFNHPWALFYQANFVVGGAAGEYRDGTAVAGFAALWTNAVMAEYTVANILKFGAGPSLDYIIGGVCGTATDTCVGAAGAAFGLNGRIALTFGKVRPGRRSSFTMGVDLHPTFTRDATFFTAMFNIGYEAH